MPKVFIEQATLSAIGDAIREKTGKTELIDPANMHNEIAAIVVGGGGEDLPEEAFLITGECNYRFANDGWNWFIETYGDRITTKDITNLSSAFYRSYKLTKIPLTLNLKDCYNFADMLRGLNQLIEVPKLRGTIKMSTSLSFGGLLSGVQQVAYLDDMLELEMLDGFNTIKVTSAYSTPQPATFNSCYSLRRVPVWWYKFKLCEDSTAFPSATYGLYSSTFSDCYSLDEAKDILVWKCQAAAASNLFSNTFKHASRIKDITFEVNNGQPIEVKWKGQTIDLSDVGKHYTSSISFPVQSGITADKRVKDDASYQALKNDPDWYTLDAAYSRYNHDSAVNTINSLPDTSAYLATQSSGTNTIKFLGAAGSSTDGGAINTLTAEEIAVATAKGWTVTLT